MEEWAGSWYQESSPKHCCSVPSEDVLPPKLLLWTTHLCSWNSEIRRCCQEATKLVNWHWCMSLLAIPRMPLAIYKTGIWEWEYEIPLLLPPKQPLFIKKMKNSQYSIWPHISKILLNSIKPVRKVNTGSLLLLPSKSHANTPKCNTNLLQKSSSKVVWESSY